MTDSIEGQEYLLKIGNKSILLDYKKFMLLKGTHEYGSITKSAKKIGIPYRTALKYIENLEKEIGSSIVASKRGGKGGGGSSQLTSVGKILIKEYAKFNSILKKHSDVNEVEGKVAEIDHDNRIMKVTLNKKIVILPIIEDLKIGDEVLLLISPEEIFIMLEAHESSVRNIFEGKIVEMGFQNEMVRVKVAIDEDISLFADITEYSRDKLGLNLGSDIFIGFKATSIPVIKI
jgi:molybdate transport system regulatory protein